MTTTGSFYNNLYGNMANVPTPEVGMGATELMWTDRQAFTIIEVSKSGKSFKMQRDKATRTDNNGMSEMQNYTFEPDPKGYIEEVTIRHTKKGTHWAIKGGTVRVLIGMRLEYYDYSF